MGGARVPGKLFPSIGNQIKAPIAMSATVLDELEFALPPRTAGRTEFIPPQCETGCQEALLSGCEGAVLVFGL